jgi:hypothetical protein
MRGVSSFLFTLTFTISSLYHILTVGLDPLQLVLVGTALEVAVFLFEVPTGIVADVYSRRLSIIIGFFIVGVGFGGIAMVSQLLSIGLNEFARRRVNLSDHVATARAVMLIYGAVSVGIIVFAVSGDFVAALVAYWLLMSIREVSEPMSRAWLNQSLEPNVRATMFSLHGQTNAIGQTAGGPPIGLVGSLGSVRAALIASGTILSFTLPFFAYTLRRQGKPVLVEE